MHSKGLWKMSPDDLRTARRALGLSQRGLAEALRLGAHGGQTVSEWERGVRPVPGPAQVAIEGLLERVK